VTAPTPPKQTSAVLQLDLAVCLVVTLLAAVTTVLDVPLILRLPLVTGLVLFIPGYGLLSALMVGSGLSALERTMVAISVSVALTIASGLLMSLVGVPIERMSWVYALTTISLVTLLVAWFRRWRDGVEGPRPARPSARRRSSSLRSCCWPTSSPPAGSSPVTSSASRPPSYGCSRATIRTRPTWAFVPLATAGHTASC